MHPFKILNAKTRTNDKFYVEFFRIKENVSNVLGRQVYSLSLPDIGFDDIQINHGRNSFVDKGKTRTGELSITFKDDEDSVVDAVVAAQVLRQLNNIHFESKPPEQRDYTFDILVRKFTSDNETESLGYKFTGCRIMNVTHGELSYANDEKGKITCNISFDVIEFDFPKKFVEVLNIDASKGTFPSGR